jgi:hypothetical protein
VNTPRLKARCLRGRMLPTFSWLVLAINVAVLTGCAAGGGGRMLLEAAYGIPAVTANERRQAEVQSRQKAGVPPHQIAFIKSAPRDFDLTFDGPGIVVTSMTSVSSLTRTTDTRDAATGYPVPLFNANYRAFSTALLKSLTNACEQDGGQWQRLEYWADRPEEIQFEKARSTLVAAGYSGRQIEQLLSFNMWSQSDIVSIRHQGFDIFLPKVAASQFYTYSMIRSQTISGLYGCSSGGRVNEVALVTIAQRLTSADPPPSLGEATALNAEGGSSGFLVVKSSTRRQY